MIDWVCLTALCARLKLALWLSCLCRGILTQYLRDYQDYSLQCVITFCSGFDMAVCNNSLRCFPSNFLYNQYLGSQLKELAQR